MLLTLILILAWGSTFAAIKVGLESSSPILFVGLRSVIGGLAVAVLAASRGRPPRIREHLASYALITLLNVVGFFYLQTLAIQHLPSGLAAVLIYLQPVLTGVLAAPLLGERLTALKLLGLGLGFGGIVVVSVGAVGGHVSGLGIGLAVAGGAGVVPRHDRVQAGVRAGRPDLGGRDLVPRRRGPAHGARRDHRGHRDRLVAQVRAGARLLLADRYGARVGAVVRARRGRCGQPRGGVHLLRAAGLAAVGAVLLGERLGASLLLGSALVVLGVFLVNRESMDSS